MTIVRINPDNRWSDAIIHNGALYSTFVPENPQGSAFEQTTNILAQIDALLLDRGSDKSRLIDVTVFLADKADFSAMNQAWDTWVIAGKAPVRCTVEAALMKPEWKVEIKVVAAI